MIEAVKPMLAETAQEAFDDPNFIYEWKYNGLRILGHKQGESVSLQGRSGADFTAQFPELAELPRHIKAERAIVDGEVVCLGDNGLPDFNRIQNRIGKREPLVIQNMMKQYPATYMVFDVVMVDEFDLTAGGGAQATQIQRKDILQKIFTPNGVIKLSPWVDGKGKELHEKAVQLNQEGVMAKRKSGLYVPGGRNQDWLKLKVPKYANFVICGYTRGTGWRQDLLGAIVLGKRENGSLRWVGCAGSGFQLKVLQDVYEALQRIRTEESPFPAGTKVPDLVSWVRPMLVAEVKYYDITKTGQLIWPIFQRVRTELALEDL